MVLEGTLVPAHAVQGDAVQQLGRLVVVAAVASAFADIAVVVIVVLPEILGSNADVFGQRMTIAEQRIVAVVIIVVVIVIVVQIERVTVVAPITILIVVVRMKRRAEQQGRQHETY